MTEKEQVLKIFPRELRSILGQVSLDFDRVQELRLRAGRPLLMVCGGREYMVGDKGETAALLGDRVGSKAFCPLVISREQVQETVEFMGCLLYTSRCV